MRKNNLKILLIIGLVFTVFIILMLSAFGQAFDTRSHNQNNSQNNSQNKNQNPLWERLILVDINSESRSVLPGFSENLIHAIASTPGVFAVGKVASLSEITLGLVSQKTQAEVILNNVSVTAMDQAARGMTYERVHLFNDPDNLEHSNDIFINTDFSKTFLNQKNPIGQIIFLNHQPYKIAGELSSLSYFQSHAPEVIIPWGVAQEINPNLFSETALLILTNPENLNLYRIEQNLQYKIKALMGIPDNITALNFLDDQNSAEKLNQMAEAISHFSLVIACLSLVSISIGLFNFLMLCFSQEAVEIALLKSLGASSYVLIRPYVIQIFICIALGVCLGGVLAGGVIHILNSLNFTLAFFGINQLILFFSWKFLFFSLGFLLFLALLICYGVFKKIRKLEIARVLSSP